MIHDRTFGIEIEAIAPAAVTMQRAAEIITAAGVDCRMGGYHVTQSHWKIVGDGSVRPAQGQTGNGMEIVSPPLQGEEGFEQVRKVCRALTAAGFKVNKSCGLHVHVAARGLGLPAIKRLTVLYSKSERTIDQLLPLSRRGGDGYFCRSLANVNEATVMGAADVTGIARHVAEVSRASQPRYVKLNLTAFWRHGTVEFRHHSGTVDENKAVNWARFCLRMVDTAVTERDEQVTSTQPRARALRPGSKVALIAELLTREWGCTQADVLTATGWPSVSMPQQARAAGITLVKRRVGGVNRYYAGQAQVVTSTAPARPSVDTLDGLTERLGMDENEKAFWAARAGEFRIAVNISQAA